MTRTRLSSTIAAVAALLLPPGGGAAAGDLVLVRDDLGSRTVRLVQLDDEEVVVLREPEGWETIDLDRCIALFDPVARPRSSGTGLLVLTDGQRLPGRPIRQAHAGEEFVAWDHAWLGRLAVPLKSIRSVQLVPGAPAVAPRDADVVLLGNGDRVEGFVLSLGDPISLEVEGAAGPVIVDVPLDRALAVAMVTPEQPAQGRRVWFRDGTVISVSSLGVGDDGFVRLSSPWVGTEMLEQRLQLEEIAAVLFDPAAMRPLAELAPSLVAGPAHRFTIPPPRRLDPDAAMALSRLEYRGPLVVHYPLPSGARRFAAEARLPAQSQDWGDYELIVRDDDREVFRASLNREQPAASINVELRGAELTIELTEGRHGPIQDHLILERAMVLR